MGGTEERGGRGSGRSRRQDYQLEVRLSAPEAPSEPSSSSSSGRSGPSPPMPLVSKPAPAEFVGATNWASVGSSNLTPPLAFGVSLDEGSANSPPGFAFLPFCLPLWLPAFGTWYMHRGFRISVSSGQRSSSSSRSRVSFVVFRPVDCDSTRRPWLTA